MNSPQILSGKLCATAIKDQIREQVSRMVAEGKRAPHLGVIQVGNNPASTTYVNNKHLACEYVGFRSTVLRLPETISQDELLQQIKEWNDDAEMDAYIVQLPLPKHINEQTILAAISPDKDADGFHPMNMGRLVTGLPGFIPATPLGIVTLLEFYKIPLKGKSCAIVGRSNIVGKPLANLLSAKGKDCTVTLCHSLTSNIKEICQKADIIVTALGVPAFLTADMVSPGAVVIDVGINRVPADNEKGFRLVGDVAYDEVAPKCSWITPVPGGVGPMTIVSLLQNTLRAVQK